MNDPVPTTNKERIEQLEECIVWLKAKIQRERNYLDYRAKRGTRTATDEIGEQDLVMEDKIKVILERMVAVNRGREDEA